MTGPDPDTPTRGSVNVPGEQGDELALRFSVVMPNFNYGRFVGDAVRSALALDWPHVEVIVVDDGSTDNSHEVLASFGDRIAVLKQPNSGPRVACNRGFAESTGDVVMFLDSDDEVEPSFVREVARVWRPGVSKVQVEMARVDADGRPLHGTMPRFSRSPSSAEIRHWMSTTGAYPTPPGSGNAYARSYLSQIFPLDSSCGDASDSACIAAAPYLGDVVTVAKPLVRYRVHENNRSKLNQPERFTRQIERAFQRHRFALRVIGAPADDKSVTTPLRRGRHLLQMRVAERRLVGGPPPLPGDTTIRQLLDAAASVVAPGPESIRQRVAVVAWTWATLLAPLRMARRLIQLRFNPTIRSHRLFWR